MTALAECSTAWDGLTAYGTAAGARFFVALEQPGPWGRDALTQSHLDRALGAELTARASGAGGRALLIRRPRHHADAHLPLSRRVYLAGGLATSPWLLTGDIDAPAALLDLPWGDLDRPAAPPVAGFAASGPVLLVCTNAKRDRCCALRGLPIAQGLAAQGLPVWECSHTGGHRFAPTGIVLPLGQVIGRLTAELGAQVLDAAASGLMAAGALGERHDRGLSHLPPAWAAAVSWVASSVGETDPRALDASGEGALVAVRHRDGRVWKLDVTQRDGDPLPESCGRPAKPSRTWVVSTAD